MQMMTFRLNSALKLSQHGTSFFFITVERKNYSFVPLIKRVSRVFVGVSRNMLWPHVLSDDMMKISN